LLREQQNQTSAANKLAMVNVVAAGVCTLNITSQEQLRHVAQIGIVIKWLQIRKSPTSR
jgi:hypothetical protein